MWAPAEPEAWLGRLDRGASAGPPHPSETCHPQPFAGSVPAGVRQRWHMVQRSPAGTVRSPGPPRNRPGERSLESFYVWGTRDRAPCWCLPGPAPSPQVDAPLRGVVEAARPRS